MSLNVKKAPMSGGKKAEVLEAASYPARLVQVVDLGLQKQEYKGEQKNPVNMGAFTYEFLDEFLKDEDGQDRKDKPRWLTETMAIHNLKAEKAKSTKRAKALDPNDKADGDFFKMVGNPVLVTVIVNEGKGKYAGQSLNRIADVAPMRAKDAEKAAPLVNSPVAFSLDTPDVELFKKFPQWVQNMIVSNLEFSGSKLEKLLTEAGEHTPPKEQVADEAPEADEDDDKPY